MEARRETPLGDTQDPFAAPGAHLRRLLRWASQHGLIPILLLAALVRFYDLTAAAIWGDEASSLLLARYSLSGIWNHAAFDVHPPLYFMLLHGWMALFGDGIFAVRCFSALAGIATVGLGCGWWIDWLPAAPPSWPGCCWRCCQRRCATARKCVCTRCSGCC